jgi:hypothetical protein
MSQVAFLTSLQKPSPTHRPGSLSELILERKKLEIFSSDQEESSTSTPALLVNGKLKSFSLDQEEPATPTPAHLEREKIKMVSLDREEPSTSTPSSRKRKQISPFDSSQVPSTPSPPKPPQKARRLISPRLDDADAVVKGILSDAVEKIREMYESSMKSQNKKKFKTLVEELFDRCKSLLNNLANFTADGTTVPADVCHFITAYLDLDPIFPEPPACWTPPEFEKAEEYTFELCKQCRDIAPFGTYDDQSLQISLDGRVISYGDGDYDLEGEGILKCGVNKVVEIVVLGSINDTGTAVLLDKEGNIWLYHAPNAADGYFTGMKSQAALVMRKGEVMFPETKLEFHEEYDEASVQCYGKLI